MTKLIKKITALLLALMLVFPSTSVFARDDISISDVEKDVDALLVANPDTDEIYYSKNQDVIFGIASMSKLMTYLVVKDELSEGKYQLSDIITVDKVSASYAAPGNSRMDLKLGEKISVEDLLSGLMVVSGNDAAAALAIKSAGSEDEFVPKMNAKAEELGLTNYEFVNPSGLTMEKEINGKKELVYNKMSAISLLKLAKHIVVKYPEVEKYGELEQLVMPERNFVGDHTHNMYETIPGLLGLKTGHTDEAKFNFTGYVDMNRYREGQKFRLITIVTGAKTRAVRKKATEALIQYVDNKYDYRDILSYEKQMPLVDFESNQIKEGSIPLYLEKPIEGIFPKNANPELTYNLFREKSAPFEDGEVLGEVLVKYEGKELGKVNLINKGYKPKLNVFSMIIESIKDFVKKLMLIF